MRYSIMLQLVAAITVIFLSTAGLFAWLQYRPTTEDNRLQSSNSSIFK